MIEKFIFALHALSALCTAIVMLCGALANFLPDGRWKTACSYVGLRVGKAREVLNSALPKQPAADLEPAKKDGAS